MSKKLDYMHGTFETEKAEKKKLNYMHGDTKNTGSAVAYLGTNLVAGAAGMVEGAVDLVGGAVAGLTGDSYYAKYLHEKSVIGEWQQAAQEKYNPDGLMKFVGDVASGVGNSAIMMIPYVGVPLFFAGASGQGVSEAVQTTGALGGKEYIYGGISGAAEGVLEKVTSGAGNVLNKIGGGAVRKGALRRVMSEAGGEFTEEFTNYYIETAAKRKVLGQEVDYNAGDAFYSGLVGMASGAMLGGVSVAASDARLSANGQKVRDGGNADTLLHTARVVTDAMAGEGTKFGGDMDADIQTLRGTVQAFDKLKNKEGARGTLMLGEIQAALAMIETKHGVLEAREKIAGMPDADMERMAQYLKEAVGKVYTAADIRADKDGILSSLAVSDWAAGVVSSAEESARTDAAVEEMRARESGSGKSGNAESGNAESGNAENGNGGAEAVENVAGADVAGENVAGADGTGTNATGADVAGAEREDIGLPAVGKKVKVTTADGVTYGIRNDGNGTYSMAKRIDEGTDGKKATWSKTRSGVTEAEIRAILYGESETDGTADTGETSGTDGTEQVKRDITGSDQEGGEKSGVQNGAQDGAQDAEQGEKREAKQGEGVQGGKKGARDAEKESGETGEGEKKTATEGNNGDVKGKKKKEERFNGKYSMREQNEARRMVEHFDSYSYGTRAGVMELIRSAKNTEADAKKTKLLANMMVRRPGLRVMFDVGLQTAGLHGVTYGGKTVILINPDKRFEETVESTIAHEFVHEIEGSESYGILAKAARASVSDAVAEKIRGEYRAYYEKRGETVSDEVLESEVVARIVGQRLGNERFLSRYVRKHNVGLIKKAFRFVAEVGRYIRTKDKDAYAVTVAMGKVFDVAMAVRGEHDGGEAVKYDSTSGKKSKEKEQLDGKPERAGGKTYKQEEADAVVDGLAKYGAQLRGKDLAEMKNRLYMLWQDAGNTQERESGAEVLARFWTMRAEGTVDVDGKKIYVPWRNGKSAKELWEKREEITRELIRSFDDHGKEVKHDSTSGKTSREKKQIERERERVKVYKQQLGQQTAKARRLEAKTLTLTERASGKLFKQSEAETVVDGLERNGARVRGKAREEMKNRLFMIWHAAGSAQERESGADVLARFWTMRAEGTVDVDGKKIYVPWCNDKSEEEIRERREEITRELIRSFDDHGKETPLAANTRKANEAVGRERVRTAVETGRVRQENRRIREETTIRVMDAGARAMENAQMAADAARVSAKLRQEAEKLKFSRPEVDEMISSVSDMMREFGGAILDGRAVKLTAREQMFLKLYLTTELNSQGERTGKAVRDIAERAAREYLLHAQAVDADGKRRLLSQYYDAETMRGIRAELAGRIYDAIGKIGKETEFSAVLRRVEAVKSNFEAERLRVRVLGQQTARLKRTVDWIRQNVETKKRKVKDEQLYELTKLMSRIISVNGQINIKSADYFMEQMERFYADGNEKLSDMFAVDAEALTEIDRYSLADVRGFVKEYRDSRAAGAGDGKTIALNATELARLADVTESFRRLIAEYDQYFIDGQYRTLSEDAMAAINDRIDLFMQEKGETDSKARKGIKKLWNLVREKYIYSVLTPEEVIASIEGYQTDGVLTKLYHEIRIGQQKADTMYKRGMSGFDDFIRDEVYTDKDGKKHKYRDKLTRETVKINGTEMSLGQGIYLFMVTKRAIAEKGLINEGVKLVDEKNNQGTRIDGMKPEEWRQAIDGQLDEQDKRFITLAEKFFSGQASEIKRDADMRYMGYTNALSGYYVPITRDRYRQDASAADMRGSIRDITTVFNEKFNQNTKQNAYALEIVNIYRVIDRHMQGLSQYANLYLPLKSFDRIYNKRVLCKSGEVMSLREMLEKHIYPKSKDYIRKLFADIQHVRTPGGVSDESFDTIYNTLIGGMAQSVLAANPKVIVTQVVSQVTATRIVNPKYQLQANIMSRETFRETQERCYKYSDIAYARNYDLDAVKSAGNLERLNRIGETLGKGIGWMDNRTVVTIYRACELQIEAERGLSVGSEENAMAAARMCDEAIMLTQAMSSTAERSDMMRSHNPILRTFVMFTGDAMKQMSFLYRAVSKYTAHTRRAEYDATYRGLLDGDKKEIRRSVAVWLTSAAALAIISQAFRYLYHKEEEDAKGKILDALSDYTGAAIGIFPIFADVYDKLANDYDLSLNFVDMFNDSVAAVGNGLSVLGRAVTGEDVKRQEVLSPLRSAIKAAAQWCGVPVTPIETVLLGLMRRFSPGSAAAYDSLFYNVGYTKLLREAVESGDDRMARQVAALLYRDVKTGTYSVAELERVAELYASGYTGVLPASVPDEIDGVTLKAKQKRAFRKVYAEASDAVSQMIADERFETLGESGQAYAIGKLYDLYYDRAADAAASTGASKDMIFAELSGAEIELVLFRAYLRGLSESEADAAVRKRKRLAYLAGIAVSDGSLSVLRYAAGSRTKADTRALRSMLAGTGKEKEYADTLFGQEAEG